MSDVNRYFQSQNDMHCADRDDYRGHTLYVEATAYDALRQRAEAAELERDTVRTDTSDRIMDLIRDLAAAERERDELRAKVAALEKEVAAYKTGRG